MVTYNHTQEDELAQYDGVTLVRCLNLLVYMYGQT
jgi:hypothetical protein